MSEGALGRIHEPAIAAIPRPRPRTEWRLAACLAFALLATLGASSTAGGSTPTPIAEAPSAPAPDTSPKPLAGLTLSEALQELRRRGLQLVFTSRIVRPTMRVSAEPRSSDLRQALTEILAPHGLVAQEGPGGTLVVVPAQATLETWEITGTVLSRELLAPILGASLQLLGTGDETRSTANGRFAFAGLPAGAYTLEAEAEGFLPEQVEHVLVGPGLAPDVQIALQPVPFVYDEIAVRPSRLSLLLREPTAPLSISRKEIDALPHLGGDVFRALSLLPGIAANDVTAQFNIHGGRRDEVLIRLDGQELYLPYHLRDFDNALSIVAEDNLASLSLTTGAFQASFGDRMSGVLDMTTATHTGAPRHRLSFSLLNAEAASSGSFRDGRGHWLASARRGSIDLAERILGQEDPAFWDAFAKAELRLDERNLLRGHMLLSSDRLDFRERTTSLEDGEEVVESRRIDTGYDDRYAWLTHQALLGRRLVVETTASATTIDTDRLGGEDEIEQSFDVRDERSFDVFALHQSWGFQPSTSHSLHGGFEVRRYDAVYDYFNLAERDFVLEAPLAEPPGAVRELRARFEGEHVGTWLSDRFSPAERLTVELGLRFDRHSLTDDSLVSPRVSLAWRVGTATVVRGAWGHFHQSQRPYELQVEDGETRFARAERSEHWVLGLERALGTSTSPLQALRVEAFGREIAHPRRRFESIFEPLNPFPEVEPDRLVIEPDGARSYGLEVIVRGAAGAKTRWWATYAYQEARDRLQGQPIRRQTDQPHSLSFILDHRFGEAWRLSIAWRYHSGWPTSPVSLVAEEDEEGEEQLVPRLGPLYSDRLSPYHRLDLRASRQWALRAGRLTLFFDVQNLYNRHNLAGFDLALDEIEVDGEEEVRLLRQPEEWTGIFPSVGVSWVF